MTETNRRTDFWAHLIADLLVRAAFFIGTAVLLLSEVGIYSWDSGWGWLAVLALSTLSALVGPKLYRKATGRGRGRLKQVRVRSQRDR